MFFSAKFAIDIRKMKKKERNKRYNELSFIIKNVWIE